MCSTLNTTHGQGIYWFKGNKGLTDIVSVVTDYEGWYTGVIIVQRDSAAIGLLITHSYHHCYYFRVNAVNTYVKRLD